MKWPKLGPKFLQLITRCFVYCHGLFQDPDVILFWPFLLLAVLSYSLKSAKYRKRKWLQFQQNNKLLPVFQLALCWIGHFARTAWSLLF